MVKTYKTFRMKKIICLKKKVLAILLDNLKYTCIPSSSLATRALILQRTSLGIQNEQSFQDT